MEVSGVLVEVNICMLGVGVGIVENGVCRAEKQVGVQEVKRVVLGVVICMMEVEDGGVEVFHFTLKKKFFVHIILK